VNLRTRTAIFWGTTGKATPAIAASGASNAADFSARAEKTSDWLGKLTFWKNARGND
jgi:hypothetical protein